MRQNFIGMVIGTAMQKTAKVRVARTALHPIVKKVSNSAVLPLRVQLLPGSLYEHLY